MNFLEIDRMIISLIQAGNPPENIIADLMVKFNWNLRQAETAIMPLVATTPVLHKNDTKPAPKKKVTKVTKKLDKVVK
jgi:predicted transcriptional regulator|tara:strand:+ start:276 stop:509 length:234 start_codon:yes stop_codon:yes gene_type:complete